MTREEVADGVPARCDVFVVGGGINGVGIARDLAGRGYSVVLAERDDLGQHTSSSSTKLIHGGLRYLEYYEFGLVRKSLLEREVLLKSAPHIIRPLRFVLPHDPSMRPAWMIRIGLFLYDHLARRAVLPGSEGINLRTHPAGEPLKPAYTQAFMYSDGWVDDARLVLLTAIDARERGATILTRTPCVRAQRSAAGWDVTMQDAAGTPTTVQARLLVNAAGPWAEQFLRAHAQPAQGEDLARRHLRLVKGSHIVVPRLFTHEHAYLFQSPDKRIIFGIPYEDDFTLIGTTDVEIKGTPEAAHVDESEVNYLCEHASRYFKQTVSPGDVKWCYFGVRPLLDGEGGNVSALTRDYVLEPDTAAAPLLTVWGGKITTYRKLAEEAATHVSGLLGDSRPAWSEGAYLPGGDLSAWIGAAQRPDVDFGRFLSELQRRHAWLPAALARRIAHAYGSRVDRMLQQARSLRDLGAEVAPGLHEAELHHMRHDEWARNAEDVLWRRSKLGLHYSTEQRRAVADWFETRR